MIIREHSIKSRKGHRLFVENGYTHHVIDGTHYCGNCHKFFGEELDIHAYVPESVIDFGGDMEYWIEEEHSGHCPYCGSETSFVHSDTFVIEKGLDEAIDILYRKGYKTFASCIGSTDSEFIYNEKQYPSILGFYVGFTGVDREIIQDTLDKLDMNKLFSIDNYSVTLRLNNSYYMGDDGRIYKINRTGNYPVKDILVEITGDITEICDNVFNTVEELVEYQNYYLLEFKRFCEALPLLIPEEIPKVVSKIKAEEDYTLSFDKDITHICPLCKHVYWKGLKIKFDIPKYNSFKANGLKFLLADHCACNCADSISMIGCSKYTVDIIKRLLNVTKIDLISCFGGDIHLIDGKYYISVFILRYSIFDDKGHLCEKCFFENEKGDYIIFNNDNNISTYGFETNHVSESIYQKAFLNHSFSTLEEAEEYMEEYLKYYWKEIENDIKE